MSDKGTQVDEIVRRLRRVRSASLTVGILSAVLLGLLVLGATWFIVSLLDMGLGVAGSTLRVIAVFLLVSALAAMAYEVVRVFSVSHSIKTYAARVGAELKEIGLDLLTALDLSQIDNRKLGYSQVLIGRVIDGIAQKVEAFDFQVSVKRKTLILLSIAIAGIVLGGTLWFRHDGATFSYSLTRLSFLWGLSSESGVKISVSPGDDEILAGTALEIDVEVQGFVRKSPILHVISAGEETGFTMEELDSLRVRGTAHYSSTLPRIDRDIGYYVSLGEVASRVYRISVYEEPRIKDGTVRLAYPAYTGLGEQTLPKGMWDMTVPYGTEARMEFHANCKPESVWLATVDSTGATDDIALTVDGDSLALARVLYRSFTYSIEMVAGDGLRAKSHGPHTVTVMKDEPPYVRIESPGSEILLEADMIVPLSVVALDDYGISMMRLHYVCPAETAWIDLPYRGKTQARSDYNWDTALLDLIPGDVITYYVAVADNDALTGPKHARTDVYVARVPTLYDLYQEIEEDQYEDLQDLEEVAEEARALKEEFEDLIEDIKRTGEMEWEEQQALKQSLAEQDEIRERLEEIAQSLDETLDRMGENPLVDFEIIDKMEELRRLFDEVATEDMRQALEDLQEAMENLSPEDIRSAMENMNLSQEDLLRRLDKTIEMLKRLRLQQKMEAVANLAKSIEEGEKQIGDLLEEGADLKDTQNRQRGLMDDTQELSEMMQELSNLMQEQQNPLSSEIDEASEFMKSSGIKEAMSLAASAMSRGQRGEAKEQAEDLEQSLSQLASMLQNARDMLFGEERREIMEALTKAMHSLRDVSARHEEVLREIEIAEGRLSDSDLARMEMVYKEALDRIAEDLFDASRKSLFVTPMLGRVVLRIGSQLSSVSDRLAQGMRGKTRQDARSALGSMNELITALMDAMDQASSCSSPSGMCDAFQSLENMCCMQMGINQGTQCLLGGGDQGLSMEARAQMARLAAEQEAVKKGIEDVAREFGDRGEILGRLDDLAEEAKRVVEDLQRGRVNQETIRRQERILTRLLNAQRSMRRRDYSERRKSRPGEPYEVERPPELSQEEQEELIRDLLYQRRGYYPPEYEELIRAYFRAISAGRTDQ